MRSTSPRLRLIDQVVNRSHLLAEVVGDVGVPRLGPIVEEADQLQPHLGRSLDVPRQLESQFVDADDGESFRL